MLRTTWPRRSRLLASISSAGGPHSVERAWLLVSKWSVPLYERPGCRGCLCSALLGSMADVGWKHPAHALYGPAPAYAAPSSLVRRRSRPYELPAPRCELWAGWSLKCAGLVAWPSGTDIS